MQKQSFLQGTFILSVSAFITRMLGFAGSIFLARMLGAEGMGLIMMAQPLVPLVITLTELGLPVAISKLVAEADVHGNPAKVKRILYVSLTVTGILSLTLTAASLLGSKWIASLLLTDQRAYYAMLAITPIAPIVAFSAVLKGYFKGKQNMTSIAYSEVFEHVVQITSILSLVQLLMPYGIEYAAAGAMAAYVVSELASLSFLYARFRLYRDKEEAGIRLTDHLRKGKQTLRELLRIGLPTTGHGIVHSIYNALQPMLITKSLGLAGIGTAAATSQFGLLAGYAFPLLFLPSFITQSLSTALIPAISEANASGNGRIMHERMDQAMRIALIVGAPSTVILYVWATPLTTLIYNAPEAGNLLQILAPIFLLYYFDAPLHAILLGLGKAGTAMWNYVISMAARAAAIFVLGSQFGIHGVALGINFGICMLTFLNFFSISGSIGFYMELRQYVKAAAGMALMALAGQYLFPLLQQAGFPLFWSVVLSAGVSLAIYFLTLLSGGIHSMRTTRP